LPAARRLSKPAVLLVALTGLALALSACVFIKEGSLSASQPGGIGPVRVHFVLCTEPEGETCNPNETEGQTQYLLGIAVPPGFSPPPSITAVPSGGGAPIVFSRNDQVASEINAATTAAEQPWPPAGLEGIGYLSDVVTEVEGPTIEWSIDADFGLPAAAGSAAYAGPFRTSPALGFRVVNNENPADRPAHCFRPGPEATPEESDAVCPPSEEETEVGISDLRIGPAANATAYVGGQTTLQFGLDFGSTATSLPSFNVTAGSTLAGAGLTVSAPTFSPAAPPADTHRSSGSETVTVTVPSTAQPGVYDVTLTATTAQGVSVSQVGKLEVTTPVLTLGKVKLNKAKGTATLPVGVPSAGTLTATGKKIVKVRRLPAGATTLKLTIRAKGKAKRLLNEKGKAKVGAKITFTPSSGAPVTKSKAIVLKKRLAP
jgi:hypothetical protein